MHFQYKPNSPLERGRARIVKWEGCVDKANNKIWRGQVRHLIINNTKKTR